MKNASCRTVGLPHTAINALRSHRKRQVEEKLRAGDYEDSGLVFASGKGTPLEAQNIVISRSVSGIHIFPSLPRR
jgi:hypothetical protein